MVGRADELGRLLAHVDRAVAGRASLRCCSPATPASARPGCSTSSPSGQRRAGRPGADRALRRPRRRRAALPAVRRPAAPGGRRPDLAPVSAANPVLAGLLAGRAGDLPARAAGERGPRPQPPAAEPGGAPAGRRRPAPAVRVRRRAHLRAGRRRPAAASSWRTCTGPTGPAATCCATCWPGCSDEPVAVVASYRADDLHRRHPLRPLLAELVRLPGVERIELAPAARRRGRRPGPRSGRVGRRAAGVAPSTTSSPGPRATRSTPRSCWPPACTARRCPLGLTDVLLARVEQRSPAAQQVLRVAAVAGRRVRHELVAAVGGLSDGDLEAALAEAVHHHLLVVSDDGRYRFRHALLREAVLADLLPGERVRLHAAIAAYLAEHTRRGNRGRAGAPRPREQRPARRLQRLARGGGGRPAASGPPPSSCSTWRRRWRSGRPCPTPRSGPGATRRRCCWRRPRPRARWGSRTARSRCCARPWRCSGRTPTRWCARACTTRSPRPWCGSRTTPAPTARARAAMALVPARPALGGAHLGRGHARADELLPRPDRRGRRRGRGGAGRGRRPRPRQRLGGHRGLPGAGAAGPDPAVDAAPARRGAAAVPAGPATSRSRCGSCSTWRPSRSRPGRIERGARAGRGAATRRARDLGIEWSFYPAELRHLQVTALYMAGDWDAQPGRGRPAGPRAGDGRARAGGGSARAGRPGRPGGARAAGLGAGR